MSFEAVGAGDNNTQLSSKYGMAPQNYVWQLFADRTVPDDDIMSVIDDAWTYSGVNMSYAFLYKDAVDNSRPGLAKKIRTKYHAYYKNTDEGNLVENYKRR